MRPTLISKQNEFKQFIVTMRALFCVLTMLFFLAFQADAQITKTTLRSDGVMLVNGQPFFPLGFYGDGITTLSAMNAAITKLNAGGFNMFYSEDSYLSYADWTSFLNTTAGTNVGVTVNFYNFDLAHQTDFINTFKNYNPILSWGVADDANNVSNSIFSKKYNNAKTNDPNHLAYASFYQTGFSTKMGYLDQAAMQSYPIFATGSIDRDYQLWIDLVNSCNTNHKTSFANPQFFRWDTNNSYRWPTSAEADVQCWLALATGMKGIYFYTFKEVNTIDVDQPALWSIAKRIASEVNTVMSPVLLDGTITRGGNTSTHVYYARWQYGTKLYVAAINAKNSSQSVSIPLSSNITGSATKVFSYRNGTLSKSGSSLTGTMAAMEVQVYSFTTTAVRAAVKSTSTVAQVFPNPASSEINIISKGSINKLMVYDNSGILKYTSTANNKSNNTLNVKSFPAGVYFIKMVKQNGETETLKFIKE
jgi:Secretion system C-terminal sorting domain